MEWQKRELGSRAPPDTRLTRICGQEKTSDGGNDLVPEFSQDPLNGIGYVSEPCTPSQDMEPRRHFPNIVFCNRQWDVNGMAVNGDNERIAAILAGIDNDHRTATRCTLEIGEE